MDQMDTERLVIYAPLHLGERAGRATVVDAKNKILCEVPETGEKGDAIAQVIVNAMNLMLQAGPPMTGNGHA